MMYMGGGVYDVYGCMVRVPGCGWHDVCLCIGVYVMWMEQCVTPPKRTGRGSPDIGVSEEVCAPPLAQGPGEDRSR